MHAILGFTDLLSNEMLGALNEKQTTAVENIKQAGNHLMTLLNDVIDLCKHDMGKLHLRTSPVALENIIQATHRIIRGAAWEKGHSGARYLRA